MLALVRQEVDSSRPGGPIADARVLTAFAAQASPLIPYIARAALEDDDRASVLFAELTAGAEEFLSNHWPDRFPPGGARARDAAAVYISMSLGQIMLRHRVAHTMELDPAEKSFTTRSALGFTDVVEAMADLFASPFGERLREGITALHDQNTTNEESAP